ncbi:PREDICTED: ZP domain-containing protein-like [Branchiostoma belcheri]|uniref:ZP domain-containing protein-like n=1 Tax=Branchiostoma belcheri TaxID=7741 RepID=A0A6P4ZE07_BRABE|nr:PREDICTED: ZP domain-containing protein-like [Branchiostoma belcheri]
MAGPCTSGFWRWIVLVVMATTATVTGQECPIAGYVSVDGVCYKDFVEKKTYDAARQTCAADGGLLAMPKDNTANSAVYNLVGAGKRWIGLTDIDIEGQWLFEDGQTLASAGYNDWNIDEPNDAGGGEDCLEVDVDSRSWNDNNCGSGFGFVCQLVALRSRLTSDDAGMSHLSVSWATGILPISGYTLRYQPADGSGSPQDLSPAPGAGATSATVSGLLADTEYTLTLTSFGDEGQPNGVISGTFTTDPVVVNVQCTQDSMSLSIPRAALPAVNVEDLHLLDPDCGATEDEDEDVFEFQTHLQECGTLQETSGEDKVIFSNVVIANQVTYENGAVRNQPVNLPFQCEFLRQYGVSQGGDIMFNIPPPRVDVVHADNTFTLEMQIYTSTDFSTEYQSSEFPIKVKPSDRLNFGLSVASPLDNLELFARDCVSTPTTSPDHSTRVNIIDDGCQVDQTLQKDPALSNDKAQYYSVAAFTFPNALDSSLVYFHCTMIICFKDDPDSRCKQGCILPAARPRRAVSDGTEGRVRRESSRDQAVDITRGPFQVKQEAGAGPAVVPLGAAVGASVGVAGIMALLILAVVLVRKRQALENMKRDDNTAGMDNYAFQVWGKTDKTGAADTKT